MNLLPSLPKFCKSLQILSQSLVTPMNLLPDSHESSSKSPKVLPILTNHCESLYLPKSLKVSNPQMNPHKSSPKSPKVLPILTNHCESSPNVSQSLMNPIPKSCKSYPKVSQVFQILSQSLPKSHKSSQILSQNPKSCLTNPLPKPPLPHESSPKIAQVF